VAGEREFQQRIQQIGNSIQELDEIADPVIRTKVNVLMQSLMELHSTGFEKTLDIIFESGDSGQPIIDRLGRDPLVGSLLVLYGLHPEDIETRIEKAIERVRPQLRKQGSEIALLASQAGMVRLRVQIEGHACGSTATTIKGLLEDAVYEAAPDIGSLEIEGLESKPATGFIALDALMGNAAAKPGATVSRRGDGAD
jgi:Fe-S cluster biogenesis protein NfuA